MARRPYPNGITEEVRAALDVLTDEEIQALRAYWRDNVFIGIGYDGPGGGMTQWAEPEKMAALTVLEAAYAIEAETYGSE